MKNLVPSFEKAQNYETKLTELEKRTSYLTSLIENARKIPSKLLENAKLPISGLIIEDGVIKIKNNKGIFIPVSNLSEGEKLELCIDIAKAKSGSLGIVLVDGFEKLDSVSREQFIEKAKESGLQFFITRVTDNELEIKEY